MDSKKCSFAIQDKTEGKYNKAKGTIKPERFELLLLKSFPNALLGTVEEIGIPDSSGRKQSLRKYELFDGNNPITEMAVNYMTEQTRVAFVGEDIEEVTTTLKANSDFEWKLLASNKN